MNQEQRAEHMQDTIETETRGACEQAYKDASVDRDVKGHRIDHAEKGARIEENIVDHELAETVDTTLRNEA